MILIRTLLALSILLSILLGFIHTAKKISCSHLFQVKAFSILTHKLHSTDAPLATNTVCGNILLTHKTDTALKVHNISQSRTLKLNIKRNILNEQISSP